jgi:hypothetical protein
MLVSSSARQLASIWGRMHRDPADHERRVEAEPVAKDLAPLALLDPCSAFLRDADVIAQHGAEI